MIFFRTKCNLTIWLKERFFWTFFSVAIQNYKYQTTNKLIVDIQNARKFNVLWKEKTPTKGLLPNAAKTCSPWSAPVFFSSIHIFFLYVFINISFFKVVFVQEKGLKLLIFWFSPPPGHRRRTDRRQNLFCI